MRNPLELIINKGGFFWYNIEIICKFMLMEKFKQSLGETFDGVQSLLEKVFDSEKSKETISRIFDSLKKMIGLKTKTDLSVLSSEIESSQASEKLRNSKSAENLVESIEEKDFAKNTMIFGDSIAVGIGQMARGVRKVVAEQGARPSKILNMIKSNFSKIHGKNALVISGFNELPNKKRGVDSAFLSAKKMVREIEQAGGKPVLCTLYPVEYSSISNDDVRDYNQRLRDYAKEKGITLVDCEKEGAKWGKTDGLHLNSDGYKQMWSFIQKEATKKVV